MSHLKAAFFTVSDGPGGVSSSAQQDQHINASARDDGIADYACSELLTDGTVRHYSCKRIRSLATQRMQAANDTGKFIGAIALANQCPSCSTVFTSIDAVRWHVHNSLTTGTCKRDKAHRPSPLIVPAEIVCP